MSGNQHADLEGEIRRLARVDAPAEEVRQAARAAYSQRERDSAVLPLVFDLLIDSDDDAIEDADATRALVFKGAGTRVELQVLGQVVRGEERRRVIAKVEGPRVLTAQIRTPSEELPLASDAQNRFVHDDVPRGPVTLLVEVEGTPPGRWHTEWTII